MKKFVLILSLCIPASFAAGNPSAYAQAAHVGGLGDLTSFDGIAEDTLGLVKAHNWAAAEKRVTDFETAWDAAEPKLYALNKDQWGVVDTAADGAISSLRKAKPNEKAASAALAELILAIHDSSDKPIVPRQRN